MMKLKWKMKENGLFTYYTKKKLNLGERGKPNLI